MFVVLVPAAIWLAAFGTLAAVLYALPRASGRGGRGIRGGLRGSPAPRWRWAGRRVPTAAGLIATGGKMGWGGVPLALVAAGLVFVALRGPRVAESWR